MSSQELGRIKEDLERLKVFITKHPRLSREINLPDLYSLVTAMDLIDDILKGKFGEIDPRIDIVKL